MHLPCATPCCSLRPHSPRVTTTQCRYLMATGKMKNVHELNALAISVVTSTSAASQRPCALSSASVPDGVVMKENKSVVQAVTQALSAAEPQPLTYAALLEYVIAPLWGTAPRTGPVPPMMRNERTRLNAWLKFAGKSLDDEIGEEFGSAFAVGLERFAAAQTALGRKPSCVRDRQYGVSRIHSAYLRLATSALPRTFAGALDALIVNSNLTCKEIALRAGISDVVVGSWRHGKSTPSIRHNRVAEVEVALGAAPGTLTSRLPRTSLPTNAAVCENGPTTPFRAHMREMLMARQYGLKHVTAQLMDEWRALLRYKTSPLPDLSRNVRGIWRAKPAAMCRVLHPAWCWELPDGRRVQSAHIAWSNVSHFLGWLTLPENEGGVALSPDEVQTVAWLAMPKLLERFMRWSAARCGAFNSHSLAALHTACSLLSPKTGYLTQCPWLKDRLPLAWQPSADWREHCESAYDELHQLRLTLAGSIQLTRDPEWAIRDIVQRPDPLTPLLNMVAAMQDAMPPFTAPHRRAVMLRDILFVALLIANPLRITQYMTLQYGPGTDENLYRDANGAWCLRFAAEHIKNGRFRPKRQRSRGYNVKVASWVVPMLESYLAEARDVLLKGARSPYLLVGQLGRHADLAVPFSNVDDRLQLLTARFIPGSAGFRGNGFRHIVATAWLKAHPRDYLTVARMLNDRLETVIEAYSHLEISDCLDEYDGWVKTLLK